MAAGSSSSFSSASSARNSCSRSSISCWLIQQTCSIFVKRKKLIIMIKKIIILILMMSCFWPREASAGCSLTGRWRQELNRSLPPRGRHLCCHFLWPSLVFGHRLAVGCSYWFWFIHRLLFLCSTEKKPIAKIEKKNVGGWNTPKAE